MLLRLALGLGRVLPRRTLTATTGGTTPTPPQQSCDQKDDTVAGRVVTPEQDKQHYMPEGMGQDPTDEGPSWLKPGETGYESKEERIPFVEDKLTGEKVCRLTCLCVPVYVSKFVHMLDRSFPEQFLPSHSHISLLPPLQQVARHGRPCRPALRLKTHNKLLGLAAGILYHCPPLPHHRTWASSKTHLKRRKTPSQNATQRMQFREHEISTAPSCCYSLICLLNYFALFPVS